MERDRPSAAFVGRALGASGLLLCLVLQLWALRAHSLSGDGAHHLVAGYQALHYGRNSVNLEHPPLAKLMMGLGMLGADPPLPEITAREAHRGADQLFLRSDLVQRTERSRVWLLACFVVPWFLVCYALGCRWERERGGSRSQSRGAGLLLVLVLGLSFPVVGNATILQTDSAVALGFAVTLWGLASFSRRPSMPWALAIGAALGGSLAAKYSAVLLLPVVALVWLRVLWRSPPGERGRRWREGVVALLSAVVVLHLVYAGANWNYDSETGQSVIAEYCRGEGTVIVEDRLQPWESRLLTLERFDPWLAQWLTGFLGVQAQNSIGVYTSYALGSVSSTGRWWYFPALLLLKTPLVLLFVLALVVGGWFAGGNAMRDGTSRDLRLPLLSTLAIYLLASSTSNYNLGIRHLLPVVPILALPVASWLVRRPRWAVTIVTLLAVESVLLAPFWLGATNTWWLGQHNPTRHALGAGNLEFRQNFVQLAAWAAEADLESEPLQVVYPTLPSEVVSAYLPQARRYDPAQAVTPGWYAVSVTVEQFVPAILAAEPADLYDFETLTSAAELWRPAWEEIRAGEDHGWVAGTFHLFRVRAD